jgi:hypothetical protein
MLVNGAAEADAQQPVAEPFGRWERTLRRCRLERRDATRADKNSMRLQHSCRAVRLDQQQRGMLSVRFLSTAAGPAGLGIQLAFAGLQEAGDRPMDCDQLRCRPHWPIRLQVSAVSFTGLIEPAGPSPLQQGRLARGSCELSARRMRCIARGSNGEEWIAEGHP